MPPRYQKPTTGVLDRIRNEMDAQGRPARAGADRLGGRRSGRSDVQSAVQQPFPEVETCCDEPFEIDGGAPQTVYAQPPAAVYDPVSHRTYVAYLGRERDLYVTYLDHLTRTVPSAPIKVGTYPVPDEDNHGAPSLTIDLDGYIHVVWGAHGSAHQHSRTNSPRDISAWTTQSLHVGTYATILTDPTTGDLFVIDRVGAGHGSSFPAHEYAGITTSTDGGTTWSSVSPIIDTTGTPETHSDAYVRGAAFDADGRISIVWTVARGTDHDGTRTDLHHAAYDPTDGHLYTADGTDLGTEVTWAEHPDCLITAGSPIPTAHLWVDGDRLVVAFKVELAGTSYAHVALWDGAAWTVTDTGVAQEAFGTYQMAYALPDGTLRALIPERTGTYTDLVLYGAPADNSAWYRIGTILEGDAGEGWERVAPISGAAVGLVAIAQQEQAGRVTTSATSADLLPLLFVEDEMVVDAPANHTHDATETPAAASDETIFAPAYSVTDGTTLDLAVTFVWGIDADGDPYYNAAGVTAGDEAVLVLDNLTGEFSLRPVEV